MNISAKRPFFVELLGTPEAGKTTVVRPIAKNLKSLGYKVKILQEAAEQIPKEFPKNSAYANIWIRLHSVNQVLQASMSDYDIVLVDRGIIDSCIWNEIFSQKGELPDTHQMLNSFIETLDVLPNLCVALHIPAEVSIQRRHGEGKIVTRVFVAYFNNVVFNFLDEIDVPKLLLDTSNITPEECAEIVTENILKQLTELQ